MSWRRLCGRVMRVVEQPALGAQPVAEEGEVRRVVADPDVLGEADRGDGVEAGLDHVAVVRGGAPRPGRRAPRGRWRPWPTAPAGATASRRAPGRRTRARRGGPSRPSRSRRRAAAGRASGPACGRPGRTSRSAPASRVASALREDRAGVGHRRAEHQLVEAVGDVVVVADHLGVAAHRVPHALHHPAPARAAPPPCGGRRRPELVEAQAAQDRRAPRSGSAPGSAGCSSGARAGRRGRPGARRSTSRSPAT